MTKKHFIALADAIRPAVENGSIKAQGIDAIVDFCISQNSNFMPQRWLGYLHGTNGKNGGKVK